MQPLHTPQDIKQLGTILSVWAHPDDETFSCAGIMAAAVQNGQRVICVTATRGEAGVQDAERWPPDQLATIREHELDEALAVMGVAEHFWLGYPDGGCGTVSLTEGAGRIGEFIRQYQPDTILTFGPDGMTGHPDHCAISAWATAAAAVADKRPAVYYAVEEKDRYERYLKAADERFDIYFNIDQPPVMSADKCAIALQLTPELCQIKRKALEAMPSQTEGMLAYFGNQEHFNAVFCLETFVAA